MANKERNKRSARQARQRERAAQDITTAGVPDTATDKAVKAPPAQVAGKGGVPAKGAASGPFGRIRAYLGAVRTEMHRVVWPSRSELVNYSVAVIVMLIVFGVLVWAVDTGFVALLVAFTGLRG